MKIEKEVFPADFSPYEHYRSILKAEKARQKIEEYLEDAELPLPYLFNRTELVKKIFSVGKKLGLSISTLHLAIKYLDKAFIICQAGIPPNSYELIALGCLVLSAKFDELDMNIPMMMDYLCISKSPFSYEMLRNIESELLMILEFDLMLPTPFVCIKSLLACGVVFENDKKEQSHHISIKTLKKVREYSYFFCNTVTERKFENVNECIRS